MSNAEAIRSTADSATPGLVCVSRNGGSDWQRVLVPLSEVRHAHLAVQRGGDFEPLPMPQLAVYLDSEWIPQRWRSGKHGRGSMKMLVEREHTEAAVYELLRAEGERRQHSWDHVERRRQRRRHRSMVGVVVPAGEEMAR